MANSIAPVEERILTPSEIDALDRRRRKGHLCLVLGYEFLIIAVLVTLWAGQDATYSPGWARPMLDWDILLFVLATVFIARGLMLRRGVNEFFSY